MGKIHPANSLVKTALSITLFIIFSILFGGANVSANPATTTASANASVNVSAACTLSGGNNNFSGTIANGVSKETSDSSTFGPTVPIKAVCNDPNGFSLYAIGYSGSSYDSSNHTKLISSLGTSYDINTATDSGANDSSYWAFKLSAIAGTYTPIIAGSSSDPERQTGDTDYSNYAVVPDDFTKVAYRTSNTDVDTLDPNDPNTTISATGSSVTPTYKIYIGGSQPAGTYSGKVKYTLVHPSTMIAGTYNIAFNANGGSGSMTGETGLYNFEDHTLPSITGATSSITPPAHYTFAGWCSVQDQSATASNPQTTCTGSGANSYPDAGTVIASTVSASGTSVPTTYNLYAYWQLATSTITLDQNGATTSSTPTSLTATYSQSTLSPSTITNPQRTYNVSGFTLGEGATGASVTFPSTGACTSASSCAYSYTFNGWYNTDASTGGTEIITNSGSLTPNNGWTDANANWTETTNHTVYARWNPNSDPSNTITLPTITKTGYNCGWSENSAASSYTYPSGYTGLVPEADMTLYGICTIKTNLSLRVSFDANVSQVAVRYGSTTGTLMGTVNTSGNSVSGLTYNANYYLIPTYKSGYEFNSWTKDAGTVGTLSSTTAANPYYQIGDGTNGVTLASKSSCQSTISGSMQDFNPCDDIAVGTTGTLTDSRDTQTYTVAKLADNKYWMVENLNLAGGTALSSSDTDVTDAYINSFTTSNNLTKSGNTIVLPASSTSGFDTNNYSYVYNSGNKSSNCASPGCYSYYSWDAATLGSGRSISTDNTNAQQSICPKNWHLPTTYNGTNSSTDFRALMIGYGGSSSVQTYNSSTNPTGATMYSKIGLGSTPNFLLAGFYDYGGQFYDGGSFGYYWSATSGNSTYARELLFNSRLVYSASNGYRYNGLSVRCVFSQ